MVAAESEMVDSCVGRKIPTAAEANVSVALYNSALKFYSQSTASEILQPYGRRRKSPNITLYGGRTVAVEQM